MVVVWSAGTYENPASPEARELLAEVRDLGVGGLLLRTAEHETVPRVLNRLQEVAEVPLLVAADAERGLAFRVREGTVSLPFAMAVGATGSEADAQASGEIAAREARAVGVHWLLAPGADVNDNPANPVINLRSYGGDPELVARMVAAFVRGAHRGGALVTAKHFPGHGDTGIDSHLALPVLDADRQRLEAVEWVPFRRAVAAGSTP
jgi:beta-N-acetylhexosaminidase